MKYDSTGYAQKIFSLIAFSAVCMTFSGCSKDTPSVDLEQKLSALEQRVSALETANQSSATNPLPATTAATASVTPVANVHFTDLADVPTADMIKEVAQLNVFEGLGTTFKPYEPMTRGEYIIWLYRAYNAEHPPEKQIRFAPGYKVPYTDIAPSHPAYKYVQAFGNGGFSVGYQNNTFQPDKPLTREEMIAIKYGVDGGEMYSDVSSGYSDDAQIDKRYHNSVYSDTIFKNNGPRGNNIMRAFGAVKAFKPKEIVQRYEAAATLWQTDHRGNFTAAKALGKTATP